MIPPGYGHICHGCGITREFDTLSERRDYAAEHCCVCEIGDRECPQHGEAPYPRRAT